MIRTDATLTGFHLNGHETIALSTASRLASCLERLAINGGLSLRIGQELWAWTLHIRPRLEYCSPLFRSELGLAGRF